MYLKTVATNRYCSAFYISFAMFICHIYFIISLANFIIKPKLAFFVRDQNTKSIHDCFVEEIKLTFLDLIDFS